MSVINEEKIKNRLNAILQTIQTEADPQLLNQYRSLIRKNVSFFQRSYLAAYLLMLQEQPQGRQRISGDDKPRNKSKGRNNSVGAEPAGGTEAARQNRRPEQQATQQPPAPVALSEDEATRLFISIGRNRRIFPREILGLIGAKTSVAKEDIGTINILNNYSFVQVRNAVAAEVVDALNGASFRGKTLTVNYARARKEDDENIPAEPVSRFPDEDAAGAEGAIDAGRAIEVDEAVDRDMDAAMGIDGAVDADVDAAMDTGAYTAYDDAGYTGAMDAGIGGADTDDIPADDPGSGDAVNG
jgi:hypothetical protein